MSKFKLTPIAMAVTLATTGTVLATPQPASTGINEEVHVLPGRTISPREEAVISSAGVKVLRHIAQARANIHDKNADGAKKELGQAERLLDIIQEALPVTKVKDRIWVAKTHLEYEDTDDVLPDLIPIYASLDELVDFMPVDQAKSHLDKAKQHLEAGDKQKAKEALEDTDAALQYTEVDLPMSATRRLVSEAKADLEQNKLDEADTALKSAEDSVVFLAFVIEQPLYTAKSLLWQGVMDYEAGNTDLAKADLQKAIGYFEKAAKSDQKYTSEAAEQLLGQARELEQDMVGGNDVKAALHHLWERTQAFADRSVEYLGAGWARYRADNPVKSDLIEAKLHLRIAGIDLFTGKETGQARNELKASAEYLGKAVEHSGPAKASEAEVKEIGDVRNAVQSLVKDPAGADQQRYAQLAQQLRGMIQAL